MLPVSCICTPHHVIGSLLQITSVLNDPLEQAKGKLLESRYSVLLAEPDVFTKPFGVVLGAVSEVEYKGEMDPAEMRLPRISI